MKPVYVLYGTETYNSEGLAQRTVEALGAEGLPAELWDMDDVDLDSFSQLGVVLIITSTFGDGDPPSNAEVLHSFLMDEGAPDLTGLRFSVCGLGDTEYEHFCQCGKDFDGRLEALGGIRLAPRADCDTDYEDLWETWLETTLSALRSLDLQRANPPVPPANTPSRDAAYDADDEDAYEELDSVPAPSGVLEPVATPVVSDVNRTAAPLGTRKNPFFATVLENRNLNHPQSHKETRHVVLSIEGSGMEYIVGDTLGIFPRNCPDLVRRVLKAVDIPREAPVLHDGNWYTIRDMLLYNKDIMVIDRRLINLAATSGSNPLFQALLTDKDAAKAYCADHHVLDLVEAASIQSAPMDFAGTLRPLAPRLYSIASSPHAYPNEIHLTVDVLRYTLHDTVRKGVSSTFLGERAGPGVEVAVYRQKTKDFFLCEDDIPIIMIGPGTGVAPFRAFLQAREARGASGQSWLFFGSQHESMDFLYRDELLAWVNEGLLARLDTAWSRDQDYKIYVQDRLYENGHAIYRWIDAGAYIYVCGDGSRMAKDVHRTLIRIIEEFGGRTRDAAEIYIDTLAKAGRYLRDVY